MKMYEKPKFALILMYEQDICTTSGEATEGVGKAEGGATFDGYDFGGKWM